MEYLLRIMLVFLLGFLSCIVLFFGLSYIGIEKPLSFGFNIMNSRLEAPSDWVRENQIEIYEDSVVIKLDGVSLSRYADTGSMKPVLDKYTNGLRIAPESEEQINIGDIVSFKYGNDLIVHRIIEKGTDEKGIYFITKGDNNDVADGKIRFEDIQYVTIGLIW